MRKVLLWIERYSARIQAVIETSLIVGGLFLLFIWLPHDILSDGLLRFQALTALLVQGALSPAVPYSLIGPLFSAPLWLLGKVVKTPETWVSHFNLLVFVLGIGVTYWLLRKHVDRGVLRRFFLLLIVASMFVPHLTNYYGEVFTTICVGFGILVIVTCGSSAGAWMAIILGTANTPASLVGLGLMLLKYCFDHKHLRYVLIVVAAGTLVMAEAWARRGDPLATGYANDTGYHTIMPYSGVVGFNYPFFFGLLSILFSFGKGLLFFAPGLLLPIRKTLCKMQAEEYPPLYRAYILWICFLLGLILVYARWWAWYGGVFWGPRFFLFAALPASLALTIRLRDKDASLLTNLLTLLVLALSAWVGISGAVFTQSVVISTCVNNNYMLEVLCYYTPEFSVLWHMFVVPQHLDAHQWKYLLYWVVALLYLGTPLVLKICQQLVVVMGNYGRIHLDWRSWRF